MGGIIGEEPADHAALESLPSRSGDFAYVL